MGDIKEEDWNLPECKYECEACQKCFCIIPSYGSITNVSQFVQFLVYNYKIEHKNKTINIQ